MLSSSSLMRLSKHLGTPHVGFPPNISSLTYLEQIEQCQSTQTMCTMLQVILRLFPRTALKQIDTKHRESLNKIHGTLWIYK